MKIEQRYKIRKAKDDDRHMNLSLQAEKMRSLAHDMHHGGARTVNNALGCIAEALAVLLEEIE